MNSIDIRTEKANAIFRYRSIQRITTLFRFMEICVFIVVISTCFSQFPISIRFSADYFKGISFGSCSPKFVFVIGNVIILILLFKSRVAENGDRYGKIDVYDEYVERCEKGVVNSKNDVVEVNEIHERKICRSQSKKMTVECNDGQNRRKLTSSITDGKILKSAECCGGETPASEICRIQSEKMTAVQCYDSQSRRKQTSSVTDTKMLTGIECCGGGAPAPEICRSQSEKMMRVECKGSESHRKLRRSVTEGKTLKNVGCCGGGTPAPAPAPAPERCGVDELSSEAFRRTVEAFIERQQRSLRDEELAPVTYVGE